MQLLCVCVDERKAMFASIYGVLCDVFYVAIIIVIVVGELWWQWSTAMVFAWQM